ncbi:MAG: glycosyltransferase [Betaproteobacteria bacterium]|nr:glycosyltransferase [Betaproteobacteria bacterium]
MSPLTVVVMPTYNEADTLAGTWRDLRAQLPDVTLLVVDDKTGNAQNRLSALLEIFDKPSRRLHLVV